MSDLFADRPPSPAARRLRTPRWLDPRLLFGLLLILGSVAIGTRVVAGVENTQLIWAATADLAAGTRLADGQLAPAEVRLTGDTPSRYLDAANSVAGYVLTRPVSDGELLPVDAVAPPGSVASAWRFVTLPVERYHYPDDLRAGELVDVYVTVDPAPDHGGHAAATLVAPALAVAAVHSGDGGFGRAAVAGSAGIELAVPAEDAGRLVEALQSGPVDLVRVPSEDAR